MSRGAGAAQADPGRWLPACGQQLRGGHTQCSEPLPEAPTAPRSSSVRPAAEACPPQPSPFLPLNVLMVNLPNSWKLKHTQDPSEKASFLTLPSVKLQF